jgi:transposase
MLDPDLFGTEAQDQPDLRTRFILLRSQGWSYARISSELGVSKPTLIKWGRQHAFAIHNLRAAETEELATRLFGERHQRWDALARQLKKLEEEIEHRNLADLSTWRLHEIAIRLRKEINALATPSRMAENGNQLAEEELVHCQREWEG